MIESAIRYVKSQLFKIIALKREPLANWYLYFQTVLDNFNNSQNLQTGMKPSEVV